ncbi:hypothetical protein BJ138DRAFT_1169287 [Hygrophoropsis aurantiaca]|uniref:Uncharacterized protein n=1 Tax=Hygrophoropsis aurantiaca TaxID=72124 RepID=A0ACB8AVN7_9AGAM|nr:hypothetical protein BJ138DRAFT_1169287 [Hygrophoropsis aurantiaca]
MASSVLHSILSPNRVLHTSPSLPELFSAPRPSTPTPTPPRRAKSPMSSSGLSSVDLQHHLYNSLLEGKTADVILHVRGTWEAVYKLHRVVLIQAGFFNSLFTAGFMESSPKFGSHMLGPDEIDIVFDDRNITRAAFEICIARLYGGGPPLYVSPTLIPTTTHPLTPAFPGPPAPDDVPQGHHPASPRFLLSLLATAVYLSIPSMVLQALSHILNTVGPYTVIQYLNFAIGLPLDYTADEPEAAVGLEKIAAIVTPDTDSSTRQSNFCPPSHAEDCDDIRDKLSQLDVQKEDPAESVSENDSEHEEHPQNGPTFYYGAVSNKIGEAAACWLARWGADMFVHEEKQAHGREMPVPTSPAPSSTPQSRRRADTLPSNSNSTNTNTCAASPHVVPLIWARGGLNSQWVRELISSDAFFIKGERERYDFACSVVELRRRQGIDDEEEKDWDIMFREGIYYANMSVDDIISFSQHISPTTGRIYVPLAALQAAHWNQSILRVQITSRSNTTTSPSSPPSSPPPPRDKELGLSVTTADILTRLSATDNHTHNPEEKEKIYYPVAHDSSLRIGDPNGIEGGSMDQLFDTIADSKAATRATTSEANFFGLKPTRPTASECVALDTTGKARWSPYPPCRFSVEFWDIDALKEKSRLHSHTIWYAGSLYNVYVQVVRKKGIQLGVYLHRQSSVDPIPAPSAPAQSTLRGDRSHNRAPSTPSTNPASASSPSVHYSPSIHPPTRSTTPNSSPSTSSGIVTSYLPSVGSIPAMAPPITPQQPYRDPRSAVSAYFAISCSSSTGASMTRFTSVPDVFSVSQSWGWKSSSLRSEEYIEVGPNGQLVRPMVPAPKELSLRATIVLGIV